MKNKFTLIFASVFAIGHASGAEGLYNVGTEAQNAMPLKWSTGLNLPYDDNVNPGGNKKDHAVSLNPFIGLSFISLTPQTTWDVYGRLGCIYYVQKPSSLVDDVYAQTSATANLTHRFDERLRFSSRNSITYELEPDYAQGFATSRLSGAYLFWATDDSLGYRWTERMATYTGITLTGLEYGKSMYKDQNRFTWEGYNQFRYQLTQERSVLTLDYRYGQTTAAGLAADSTNQYILAGLEHRFSPTAILVTKVGLQIRQVDRGTTTDNPYGEMALDSRINQDFTLKGFLRYSIEGYDTVQTVGADAYDFSQRQTLRVGLSGNYAVSSMVSIFSGIDYIPAKFSDGHRVAGTGPLSSSGLTQHLFNASLGFSVKLIERFYGNVAYNYTDSNSEVSKAYNRSRITVGVSYQF